MLYAGGKKLSISNKMGPGLRTAKAQPVFEHNSIWNDFQYNLLDKLKL